MKKFKKEDIRQLLETRDDAVIRGLMRIYSFQTQDEQDTQHTRHRNGVGFNGADSRLLSDIAQQYQRTGRLSTTQVSLVRKRILKYAGQLADYANSKV